MFVYFHASLQNGHHPHQHSVTIFCYSHSSCKLFQVPKSILYFFYTKSSYTFLISPKDSSFHAKFGFQDWICDLAPHIVHPVNLQFDFPPCHHRWSPWWQRHQTVLKSQYSSTTLPESSNIQFIPVHHHKTLPFNIKHLQFIMSQ